MKNRKTVLSGVTLGGVMLLLIALGILISVANVSESETKELPMLFVAERISPVLGYIYAFLLFGGMMGTSVSSVVALTTFAVMKKPSVEKKKPLFVILVCFGGFVLSLVGFSELIGIIYPVFGYLGFGALVLILINYFRSYSCR